MSNTSVQPDPLSPLKRALIAIKDLTTKLEKAEKANLEPIAVVGMSCRMPNANNIEEFWQLLKNGVDAVSEVPENRWDIDSYYDQDSSIAGKMSSRWGAFLSGVDQFDPMFFGISPREASAMDPQQRIFLEVAWEALENAGQTTENLSNSQTGVFVGIYNSDYAWMQFDDINSISTYTGTGVAHSIVANRLSYVLNLKGPSLSIDTACSSSITAIHYACQSLRNKESNLAVAGGINLILSPVSTVTVCKILGMAADGRCKTFDARADGIVRGEGCGVVILKRLSDAIADNDNILAIIRGSAINQDGRGAGLTAPNVLAHTSVIKAAIENAQIQPNQVDYIEAHGTGTSLGDPIEVQALGMVYNQPRPDNSKCFISSVKTNIGHLEAAAGIAGLIKAILCLQNQTIVPNLHFQSLNPNISLTGTPFFIPTKLYPWLRTDNPRFAAVSSFGLGGSNSHIIIQDAPLRENLKPSTQALNKYHLLLLSGKNEKGLIEVVKKYEEYLEKTEKELEEITYSAAVRKNHLEERLGVVGRNKEELIEQLREYREKGKKREKGEKEKIVYVFSGQGPQWWAMAQGLMKEEELCKKVIEECSQELSKYTEWNLIEELNKEAEESRIEQTEIGQAAIFAVQVAIAKLLESWGVKASAVVGHSVGEIAAAHISGVLSLEDAIKVVHHRGKLMQRKTGQGKTAALGVSLSQAEQMLEGYGKQLSIAAHNSPTSVTVSGDSDILSQLLQDWQSQGIYCKMLKVDYAFHSPQMTSLQAELIASLSDIKPLNPSIPICSTVTAEFYAKFDNHYWASNIRATVLFAQAIEQLVKLDNHIFIEISPHPVLSLYLNEIIESLDSQALVLSTLNRASSASFSLLSLLANLYSLSIPLDFSSIFPSSSFVPLPSYPWLHQRCWLEQKTETKITKPLTENWQEWLYKIDWLKKALSNESNQLTSEKGLWLIIGDTSIGKHIADLLETFGQKSLLSSLNESKNKPLSIVDYQQLLGSAINSHSTILGIIHLSGFDDRELNLTTLLAEQETGCFSVMMLVQAISQIEWSSKTPRLWLVTKNTQPINNNISLADATIWGLAKVIAFEHPELHCSRVDLSEANNIELESLISELLSDSQEDQIALRGQDRYIARLLQTKTQAIKHFTFVSDKATYLITGGTGGLGLATAEYLIKQGAKYLILVSRKGANAQIQEQLNQLSTKATIKVCCLDISQSDQFSILEHELKSMPDLKGVIHCAGILDDATLLQLNKERFQQVMLPKLNGSWNLHIFTKDKNLDFFVLFSSIASLLGSPGQGNYAAANAFLDALAYYRQEQGLPAISINWGLWADIGMINSLEDNQRLQQAGLGSINPAQGMTILRNLTYNSLQTKLPQIGVVPIKWELLAKLYPNIEQIPMFSELVSGTKSKNELTDNKTLRLTLSSQEQIQEYFLQTISKITGLEASSIKTEALLYDLGLDSLMAVELKNKVEHDLNITLSIKSLFQQASIKWLSKEVLGKIPKNTNGEIKATIYKLDKPSKIEELAPKTNIEEPTEKPNIALYNKLYNETTNTNKNPWFIFPKANPLAKLRLFCFAYAGGSASIFHSWPIKLAPEIEVCAIQLPGRGNRIGETLLTSLEEVAKQITEAITPYLDKPFAMFGHCVGAILMFEVARNICLQHNKLPLHLFPSGAAAPHLYMATQAYTLSDEGFIDTLKFINFSSTETLVKDPSLQELLFPSLRMDFEMAAKYRYKDALALELPITAFGAWEDVFAPPNVVNRWREYSDNNFSSIIYPGGHYFLETEESAILEQISQELVKDLKEHTLLPSSIARIQSLIEPNIIITKPNPDNKKPSLTIKTTNKKQALVSLTPNSQAEIRLFCFPYAGGESNIFEKWPEKLTNLDIYAVELAGHGMRSKETPLVSISSMVEDLLPAFVDYLEKPFAFFGHDLGAILMFELSKKLYQEYGYAPKQLLISAAAAPHIYYFAPIYALPKNRLLNALNYLHFPSSFLPDFAVRLNIVRADFQTMTDYIYSNTINLDVPITAFFPNSDRFVPLCGVEQWSKYSQDFMIKFLSGNHYYLQDPSDEFFIMVNERLLPK